MLDNEPNDTQRAAESATTGSETGSSDSAAKPARKRAAAKRTTKKTAAKAGPGTENAVVAQTTAPEIAPVETDGLPGQPGDVLPAKRAAKKASATTKRAAKKASTAATTATKAVGSSGVRKVATSRTG